MFNTLILQCHSNINIIQRMQLIIHAYILNTMCVRMLDSGVRLCIIIYEFPYIPFGPILPRKTNECTERLSYVRSFYKPKLMTMT